MNLNRAAKRTPNETGEMRCKSLSVRQSVNFASSPPAKVPVATSITEMEDCVALLPVVIRKTRIWTRDWTITRVSMGTQLCSAPKEYMRSVALQCAAQMLCAHKW